MSTSSSTAWTGGDGGTKGGGGGSGGGGRIGREAAAALIGRTHCTLCGTDHLAQRGAAQCSTAQHSAAQRSTAHLCHGAAQLLCHWDQVVLRWENFVFAL